MQEIMHLLSKLHKIYAKNQEGKTSLFHVAADKGTPGKNKK